MRMKSKASSQTADILIGKLLLCDPWIYHCLLTIEVDRCNASRNMSKPLTEPAHYILFLIGTNLLKPGFFFLRAATLRFLGGFPELTPDWGSHINSQQSAGVVMAFSNQIRITDMLCFVHVKKQRIMKIQQKEENKPLQQKQQVKKKFQASVSQF